jgi:hypothetical protein
MRKALLAFLLLYSFFVSIAQQNLPVFNYIPQAPTTAAFTRYGDIPVDLSTGVTAINIPVYTLSENGINVPISISYHASGIKVNDIASSVGLGWTLNAGGVITRTVMGIKDELLDIRVDGNPMYIKPPFKNATEFENYRWIQHSNSHQIWANEVFGMLTYSGTYDFYSDRFYYNLGNGESGVFRKDFVTDVIKFMPYKPMKARLIPDNSIYGGLKIELTTSDGTRYLFKRNLYDTWHPEKIFNSSNTDSIVFYTHAETINIWSYNIRQEFGPYRNTLGTKTEPYVETVLGQPGTCKLRIKDNNVPSAPLYKGTSQTDEVVLVDSIVGTNGVVRFTYAKDRQDATMFNSISALSRLVNIQVFNRSSGRLIKNVNFLHNYSGNSSSDKRLMLTGIQTGANGEEKHEFTYNPESLPAYYMTYSSESSTPVFLHDLWGYYRGGRASISNMFNDFAPVGDPDLFPNEEMTKACILQQIRYPTGGKTVFEYESHRVPTYFYGPGFIAPPADGKVGGLRIKKVSSYAQEGVVPQVKTYEYVCDLPSGYGQLDFQKFVYSQDTWNFLGKNYNACGADPAEYGLSYKNVCVTSPMGRYIGGPKAPVYYSKVTEYNGDGSKNAGKTVYYYKMPEYYYYEDVGYQPQFYGPWDRDLGSYLPPLEKKEEYKYENGQYKLVHKTENEYSKLFDRFLTGFNLASELQFNNLNDDIHVAFDHYNLYLNNDYYFKLHFSEPEAFSMLDVPSKISAYDYVDDNNYLLTTTEYTHNQFGQQTSAITTTSKGERVKSKFTYPVDYPAQAPYSTMIERNILTPVIEQSSTKIAAGNTESFLQSTKTNYGYWNYATQTFGNTVTNQILPQNVETKKGTKNTETRIQYYSYDDKGNALYVAKENDARQMYFWGYNKTYSIAQAMNVPEDQRLYVSYNSFEDNKIENWVPLYEKRIVEDNTAPMGKKCLLLAFGNISKSLNPASSYILSYWYKEGSTVNVAANSTILTFSSPKNGWVYMKRKITGSSTISISGSGYIDELRLYPETARMITFAYEPLIGLTAQCDANDRITYYTYDASGRLSLVKDDNGNILKKICYNFQGQPDACGENGLPLWQLTGAMRCKPCAQSPGHFTPITQLEERDNNGNSETYGNTRWRDSGVISGPNGCAVGDWQLTGNLRCKIIGGQLTGEQEREWKDMNPCSPESGNTVWENTGMNTAACPKPVIFQSLDVSGIYYKQNCSAQQLPKPYPVTMPPGSFTSTIDIQDATNKAKAEAQRLANQNGECVTVYVKAVLVPNTNGNENWQLNDLYFKFYSDAAGTIPLTLPQWIEVNYGIHVWWTANGTVNYDEGIREEGHHVIYEGNYDFIVNDFETSFCQGILCSHQEIVIMPGNYIIIP